MLLMVGVFPALFPGGAWPGPQLAAIPVAAAVALLSLDPVLEVFQSAEDGQPAAAVDAAVRAVLLGAGVLAVAGLVALLDRGVTLSERPGAAS
jgi:hypothetical protein